MPQDSTPKGPSISIVVNSILIVFVTAVSLTTEIDCQQIAEKYATAENGCWLNNVYSHSSTPSSESGSARDGAPAAPQSSIHRSAV